MTKDERRVEREKFLEDIQKTVSQARSVPGSAPCMELMALLAMGIGVINDNLIRIAEAIEAREES